MFEEGKIDISNIRVQPFDYIKTSDYLKELNLQNEVRLDDIGAHNLYLFKVQVMDQSYIIRRRVKDFQQLEQSVKHDPFLFMKHKEVTKESMEDTPKEKQRILFNFLKQVLRDNENNERPSEELLKFFEISDVKYGDFRKYKECTLKKRAGGRFSESRCARCGTLWGRWSKRYFYISNNGLMYCKGPYGQRAQMRELLIFDYNFKIKYGKAGTGFDRGIKLEFTTRHLLLVAPDYFTFTEFLTALNQAQKECPYMQLHRFNSFAPIQSSDCKWYIDGQDYFSDVMDALLSAQQYVYITDWWMSPDLYLRRPISTDYDDLTNRESRLDNILKKIADQGTQVYILMYQEPTLAIKHDSLYTKTYLEQLSTNIVIMRHPNQPTIPFKWSHHEKIVVVDGRVGFLGGLDLCFGRMDTQEHKLSDLDVRQQFWPGIDYANNRIRDFGNIKNSNESSINRNIPRMPWHDIAIRVIGQSVSDLQRHFEQYWNHATINQNFDQREQKQVLQGRSKKNSAYTLVEEQRQNDKDNFFKIYKQQIINEYQENNTQEESKENMDIILQQESENLFRSTNFRQRISTIHPNQQTCNRNFLDFLDKIEEQTQEVEADQEQKTLITSENNPRQSKIMIQPKIVVTKEKGDCLTQIIRSASNWSIGCSTLNTEFSIQIAYTQLISEAKNYIYIENQFFISSTDRHNLIENKIADVIVKRIKEAAARRERFKVIVFIPLLPGFEGEIDSPNSTIMKIQLHWEYFTISRGGQSILEQLRKDVNIPDPSQYIEFFSLRTHAKILDIPKTEQIYIHSKLMIVDDEFALIGSANINDRSLLGCRDSEIGIVVYDNNKIFVEMAQENVRRSKFAHELRSSLYMEHFGLEYQQVIDPLDEKLESLMRKNVRQNTLIYRTIFACYPDDQVKCISDYQKFKNSGDLQKYDELKDQIVGHAVEFPLDFLCNENLKIGKLQLEIIVPDINFT